jgi:hypothetical protein
VILHAYVGEATHHLKSGSVRRFRPKDEMLVCTPDGQVLGTESRRRNPIEKLGEGGLSARLFVGLSVGQAHRFTIRQVVDTTIEIRKKQEQLPDATFLAQKGVYTESKGGRIIEEDSVQIIIIDVMGTPEPKFTEYMEQLAEELRKRFKQESVILEVQKRGVVQAVYSVYR